MLQVRWFGEKRAVYMDLVETTTKVNVAYGTLKRAAPEQRAQMDAVDDLSLAFERILELMPRLSA